MPLEADLGSRARTWLFVPGDRPERFDKAANSGADVVVLDLEDAVSPDKKDEARHSVEEWLRRSTVATAVRINGVGTPWHDADLVRLGSLTPGQPLLLLLPKAQSAEDPEAVLARLASGSAIVALIETARGVLDASALAASPGVVRLALGTFDLAAELGVDPDHVPAMAAARGTLVLASAAAGLSGPIDGVTAEVGNAARVTEDVVAAVSVGFSGKLCIHPDQVRPAAQALVPSAHEVAWARRILSSAALYDEGVHLVDGRLVDAPIVARARRLLQVVTDQSVKP